MTEFKVGDEVTYVPYHDAFTAVVRGLSYMRDQYIYDLKLTGGARTLSSGRSILESKFYVPYEGEEE